MLFVTGYKTLLNRSRLTVFNRNNCTPLKFAHIWIIVKVIKYSHAYMVIIELLLFSSLVVVWSFSSLLFSYKNLASDKPPIIPNKETAVSCVDSLAFKSAILPFVAKNMVIELLVAFAAIPHDTLNNVDIDDNSKKYDESNVGANISIVNPISLNISAHNLNSLTCESKYGEHE